MKWRRLIKSLFLHILTVSQELLLFCRCHFERSENSCGLDINDQISPGVYPVRVTGVEMTGALSAAFSQRAETERLG
ncbi:MAG: hypothetical protein CVU64_03395 [Deltaproteobacteria bacterium HGW-Deltaproteobacteria-21]|nr:MAG: hypothetical protein CVU64_03395 [Deltaproteobacteria bacterium HGW-Deltaproteobacteria-21]